MPTWITKGFDAFRRGTFGNAGQNLYVSRAGILQRIHHFDLNGDGWVDLIFCNAQQHWEAPPAFLYTDPLHDDKPIELPSDGAVSGAVADLNGDGFEDLVLGMEYNGATMSLNAFVYYGSEEGLSEKHHARLPAPESSSVAIGDFNGDGRPDFAFACAGKLRIFYQSKIGWEPKRFVDLDVKAEQLASADIDGDGFADLVVMSEGEPTRIFWGGRDGIVATRMTDFTVEADAPAVAIEREQVSAEEAMTPIAPVANVVTIGGVAHVFVPTVRRCCLVPIAKNRAAGPPLVFDIPSAMAVAAGDFDGDGKLALAFATRNEGSFVYGADGTHRTRLPSDRACDIAAADLDGDGRDEIIVCQHRTAESYSSHALIYRGDASAPVKLRTEGARRVLVLRPRGSSSRPQLVFVNQMAREALGKVRPVIYYGGPDGFRADRCDTVPGLGTTAALFVDVNDDGIADLVTANCAENAVHLDHGSYVFLNSRDGLPKEPSLILPTRHAMAVVCADIKRDGYLDLIFAGWGIPEITIFFGNARGFDTENPQRIRIEEDGIAYTELRRMCLADLNNDGWLDLVITDATHERSFILWGGPEGFSFDRRQALSVIRGSTPQAVDLNGNGYLDLIIGGHRTRDANLPPESFVYIYYNGPDGLSESRRTILPANAVLGIVVADFNNDGHLDLFVANYHAAHERDIDSYIYWGDDRGTFSARRVTPLRTHSAAGVIAADFNEDGWIDLAVANHKTFNDHIGDSCVWWNSASGFDENRTTRLPTMGPHGMIHAQVGNQRDRGPEEFYVSEPHELPRDALVKEIVCDADVPAKTWLRAEVRTSATRDDLERSEWREAKHLDESTRGPWVQFRLALGAINSVNTPRVREVRVTYE